MLVHLPGPLWKSLIALFGMLRLVYGTNSPLIFASLISYSLIHFHLSHMAVHHLHRLQYHHFYLLLLAQRFILYIRVKTWLFGKSFSPLTFSSPTGLMPRTLGPFWRLGRYSAQRLDLFARLIVAFWNVLKINALSFIHIAVRLVSGVRRRPHDSSPTQPPLVSSAVKDHFQDYRLRIEMHPRRGTSMSASMRAGGESSRMSSTAVCIDWMCRPAKSTYVGGPAQLRLPLAHSVEQSATSALRESSLSLNMFQRRMKTHLFGQSWTPPGGVVASVILAPDINVTTYFLTYLRSQKQ